MLGIFTVDNERQHHAPPATRLSEAPRGPAGHWLHSLNGYFQISGGKNVFQREAGRRFSQYALWRVHPRYQTDSGSRKRRPSVVRLKSHNPRSKESFKPGRKYNFVTNAGKRWWFVQTMLNENGIKTFFFFADVSYETLMPAFDVLSIVLWSCRKLKGEIGGVLAGERKGRRTRSTTGLSGTRQTEMRRPCVTCRDLALRMWGHTGKFLIEKTQDQRSDFFYTFFFYSLREGLIFLKPTLPLSTPSKALIF